MSSAVSDQQAIVRTARKRYRCICADEILRYRVRGTYDRGYSETYASTLDEAEAERDRRLHRPATVSAARVEIIPQRNPNYSPDCDETIEPGDRYVEYLGESAAWESGSRYCLRCGEAVWGIA